MVGQLQDQQIKLKRIYIESQLPKQLAPLRTLANNLWWSWNQDAIQLFKSIDEANFVAVNYNPVALLDTLSPEKIKELLDDKSFLKQLKKVEKAFQTYMAEKPKTGQGKIAYFSMEYGLHISLRLYSGGLGVLAGDYMKEASDSNVDMFGIGLLYRYGYFNQEISLHGDQIHKFPPQEFTKLPLKPVRDANGEWLKISIDLPGRKVFAKVWELPVGRISLYLLDADIDDNSWDDRALTHQLYGGNNEHRLKQEMLLGIGGARAVQAMNITPDLYHCNEGHAAFQGLERLRNLVQDQHCTYAKALEIVRASSLFTTHTPVPAGHDHFPEDLFHAYMAPYAEQLHIGWRELLALGRIDADNGSEPFNMSHLAIRLSNKVNGVSKLHGEVSQAMFSILYPSYGVEEVPIGYVTNSVHYPTWIAKEWHDLFRDTFGDFVRDQSNKDHWRKIHKVSDATIMDIRSRLKKKLLAYAHGKLQIDLRRRGENPRAIFSVLNNIREDALIIGFARRFATYKRAHLLFTNKDRLRAIVNHADRPVMFLFAGKAHPADGGGQDLIRQINELSKDPDFAGKIIFLEDYNMEMAKLLVQGVDIWLNTPTRPLEASGTSGMKAAMNGVVNFSVLDGWWAEGYRPDAGWALSIDRTYEEQHLQNELDAENIYNILENDIIPTYFNQDEKGISSEWVSYVKQIIAEVAPYFTMKRMMDDYYRKFYQPLWERTQTFRQNDYQPAEQLALWKANIALHWPELHTSKVQSFDSSNQALPVGENFEASVQVHHPGIAADHLQVEAVFFDRISESEIRLIKVIPFQQQSQNGQMSIFTLQEDPRLAGVFEYGFRISPKHKLLDDSAKAGLVHWAGW